MISVVLVSLLLSASAGARQQRTYYCTETIHRGALGFGVVFLGTNHARLVAGCRIFARGGFRIRWTEYAPAGWAVAAAYINPTVKMDAILIAPKAARDEIFNAVNKRIFTDAGWILIRR